jgi:hypothetical protein
LTISGAVVNPSLTGASFVMSGSAGNITLMFHSPTALASGAVTLGSLVAQVPNTASYKAKTLLHVGSPQLNGGAISVVGDDGIQVVAYLGDATGDGLYTAADSALASRVSVGMDAGFSAFRLADPVVIADINRNNRVDSGDASILLQVAAGNTSPFVPPIPNPEPPIVPVGPDPVLSLPVGLPAAVGTTVTVPVDLDDPVPAGSTGMIEAVLALHYDPNLLSVSSADIHLGSIPLSSSGWQVFTVQNAATGQLVIDLYSSQAITSPVGGSLVTIDFHVQPGAALGTTSIQLVDSVTPMGQHEFKTSVSDAQGAFILNPAPSRIGSPDGIAGSITVLGNTQAFGGVGDGASVVFAVAPTGDAAASSAEISSQAIASSAAPPVLDEVFQGMLERTAEAAAQWLGSVRFDQNEFDVRASQLEEFIARSFAALDRPSASRDSLESDPLSSPGKEAVFDIDWLWGIAQELDNRSKQQPNALTDQVEADELLASVFRLDEYFAQSGVARGEADD